MIRKLFFLLVLLCLNSGCSMGTLESNSSENLADEGIHTPNGQTKENAALRRERHREMILAKLERLGRKP